MTDVYKTHLSQATKKDGVHPKKNVNQQLPPVVSGYDTSDFYDYRAESPNSQTGEKIKQQFLSQLHVESLTAQVERLRVSQRERDIEITRLKAENKNLEHETAEAPAIIRRLKEEVAAARAKVKMYYAQIGDDSRVIRQMHDDHLKQKQTIAKLESLVSQKHLADRDHLSAQLHEANAKISELQKQWAEAERKLEIVDRNLNSDNRYLRGKIAALEKEKELVHDQIKEYEENIKEKEKIIASLSIYRYNAIHRKQDAGCKVCNKREKEEAEARKRMAIIEQLPQFEIKNLSITSPTSIEFQIQLAKEYPPNHQFTYSQLRLIYSPDATMTENLQKRKLDALSFQRADDFVFKVEGFISGTTYYLGISSGHQDVFSNAVNPKTVLIGKDRVNTDKAVDTIPNPPKLVTTEVIHNPEIIQIIFQAPEFNKSSKVLRYRVYQSNSPDFSDQYLALELPIELLDDSQKNLTISIPDPLTAVPYYFKLAAVNAKGESKLSEVSNETIIDYPPEKPTKPIIKRQSIRSMHITSICPPGLGTFPSRFKVTMVTVPKITTSMPNPKADAKKETSIIVPATIHTGGKRELHYTVAEVDPSLSYSFSVVAINSIGFSESSEWSDDVDIEYLVPAYPELKVSVTSATSFTIIAPSSKEIKQPTILGFKVQWATNYEMTENLRSSPLLPCDLKPHLFDNLAEGELIYVSACLVGEVEEGLPSMPVFVPLASSIPLPPSPPPPGSKDDVTQDDISQGALKKNSLTSSSRFSIHEKSTIIHFGRSSYHEPPQPKVRQSIFKRSQTSLSEVRDSPNVLKRKSAVHQKANPTFQRKESNASIERKKSFYKSGSLSQVSKEK